MAEKITSLNFLCIFTLSLPFIIISQGILSKYNYALLKLLTKSVINLRNFIKAILYSHTNNFVGVAMCFQPR